MTLLQLKYLVMVADFQSITLASRLLFTTPQNISKAIKSLEEELDESCFSREKEGMMLTKMGSEVYAIAKEMLSLEEKLQGLFIKKEVPDCMGILRVYFSYGLSYLLNGLIQHLKSTNNNIGFLANECDATNLVSHIIREDSCDCSFIETDKDILLSSTDLNTFFEIYCLKTEPLKLIASRNSPLKNHSSISVSSLKNLNFISLLDGNGIYSLNAKQIIERKFNIELKSDFYSNSPKLLSTGLVDNFYGLSTQSTFLQIGSDPLITIPIKEHIPISTLFLWSRHQKNHNLKYFKELVFNVYGNEIIPVS